METKIFFIKRGKKIPFCDFLENEKKKRVITEKKLGELCGVKGMHAYIHPMNKGVPNSPTAEKFEKIIKALGYAVSDFEVGSLVHSCPDRQDMKYEDVLANIGNQLLRINEERIQQRLRPQLLSSTALRKILGHTSKEYFRYAHTFKDRVKLLDDLYNLDPKYKVIKLQHQDQSKRGQPKSLQTDERDLIINVLLEYSEHKKGARTLPRGIYEDVMKRLASINQRRSKDSVRYHVARIWYNRKKPTGFLRGSPVISDSRVKEILSDRIAETQKRRTTSQTQQLAKAIVPEDRGNRRRENYHKYSSRGHNNLVVFLIDPENYHKYIGPDISLFALDFPVDDVDEVLLARFKERVAHLKAEHRAFPDEAEVIDFEQAWLRCDMIFRKHHGGILVVEVKQYAVDRPNSTFKNGTKACQQLSGYCGIILDNIIRHNFDNIKNDNYRPIKESVDGYLAAYKIEPYFMTHLNRAGNRSPVVVPKEVVDKYIGRLE